LQLLRTFSFYPASGTEENVAGCLALADFLGETFSKSNSSGSKNEVRGEKKKYCFFHVVPGGTSSDRDWEAQQYKLLRLPDLQF